MQNGPLQLIEACPYNLLKTALDNNPTLYR
jgi:hypothetical protein